MIRLAVLGLGERGRQRLQTLSALPGVAVEMVYDRDETARRWVKERYPEVEVAADLHRVLSDLSIHAVVVALPAAEQSPSACQAIASGKHCLVEWPPAVSLEGLKEIQAFSLERKRVAVVSLPLLFHPAAARARELIKRNDLGRLFYVSAVHRRPGSSPMEQHVTWSLSYEEIALALFMLGETPRRVRATGFYFLNHRADTVSLHLEFLSGRHALLEASGLDAEPVRSFSVVGSKRSARLDLMNAQAPLALHTTLREKEGIGSHPWAAETRWLSLPGAPPLQEETRHFLECIGQGRTPMTDLGLIEDVLRVLLAVDLSLRYDGAQVDVSRLSVQIPTGWRAAA